MPDPDAALPAASLADLSRYDDWLAWLAQRAASEPDVRAIWVGGSAATGGYDEWSDLDLEVLVTPGAHAEVYDRWLARIHDDFAVDHVWEVPVEVWPDGRQCFVNHQARAGLLQEPTRIVDLHLSSLSDEHRCVDVRRHGTPIVLHDPDGVVELRHDDQAALDHAISGSLSQARQRRGTGEWLVNRALARGHRAEALDLYLRFGLAPVVRMLRVEHCPWRHDFGLRYLDTDLPPQVALRVLALVPGAEGGPGLRELSAACFGWYDELLAEG